MVLSYCFSIRMLRWLFLQLLLLKTLTLLNFLNGLVHLSFWKCPLSILGIIKMRILKLASLQYRAWSDCTDVQVGWFLYYSNVRIIRPPMVLVENGLNSEQFSLMRPILHWKMYFSTETSGRNSVQTVFIVDLYCIGFSLSTLVLAGKGLNNFFLFYCYFSNEQ